MRTECDTQIISLLTCTDCSLWCRCVGIVAIRMSRRGDEEEEEGEQDEEDGEGEPEVIDSGNYYAFTPTPIYFR